MEGEDYKRNDRPNKGKPPAYLVDYEVPPHVRRQNPIAAGPPAPPGNVPAEDDDARSVKSHHSTHSMFSEMSVGAKARKKQFQAQLLEEKLLMDMEEELDKSEMELRKRKLERERRLSQIRSQIDKAEIEEEFGVELDPQPPVQRQQLNVKAPEFVP